MRLKPQTYALTAVAHQRRRIFQRTEPAELLIATLFRYRDSDKFRLHAFVVMPDHIHVLLTPARDLAIERCAQLIKGGFSFATRKTIPGEIWQEGYHAHRIADDEDLRNQTIYILNNPTKKRLDGYPWVPSSPPFAQRMGRSAEYQSQGLKPLFWRLLGMPGLKSGPIPPASCQILFSNPLSQRHFHTKTPAPVQLK